MIAPAQTEKKYYVYLYAYPESMGGAIFYVGKGYNTLGGVDRIDMHEREAKRGFKGKKYDAIRQIWENGQQVIKQKLASFEKERDAFIYEFAMIGLFASSQLTNVQHNEYERERRMRRNLNCLPQPQEKIIGWNQYIPPEKDRVTQGNEEYLTAPQAMEYLGISSRNTLERLVEKGKLTKYKQRFSRVVLFKKTELDTLKQVEPIKEEE